MKREGKITILITLGLLFFFLDKEIFKWINLIKYSALEKFFLGLTFVSSSIILFFILTSLFLYKEHKRRWILPLWLTFVADIIIAFIIKFSVHRLRPYQSGLIQIMSVLVEKSHMVWDYSFPSFHALLVFSSIPLISKEFPKIKYFWIVFAALIAFTRVYLGLHYLTDIFFGALIGYGIGYFFIKIEEKYKFGEKLYNKIFKN